MKPSRRSSHLFILAGPREALAADLTSNGTGLTSPGLALVVDNLFRERNTAVGSLDFSDCLPV